jgi:uncharacterized protein YndB with AHSA1/START domain
MNADPGTPGTRSVELVRTFAAIPSRVYRLLADPEELTRWYVERVEGSLATGTRSGLVWPDARAWWEVQVSESGRRIRLLRPRGPGDRWVTTVDIALERAGAGTRLTLTEGPFDLAEPGALDAWAEALEDWTDTLALLRAYADYAVDLRPRRY